MARKLMTAKEKRAKNNAQQKAYRERNPELVDLWRQRSYARFLLQRGWKVEAPAGMKTPEEVRQKRDTVQEINRLLDNGPLFDPDAFARMEPPAGPTMEADEDISDLFDVPDDLIKP